MQLVRLLLVGETLAWAIHPFEGDTRGRVMEILGAGILVMVVLQAEQALLDWIALAHPVLHIWH